MSEIAKTVRNNFLQVRQRVEQAAIDAGRDATEVQIVGVTKYVDADVVKMLFEAGCQNIGESRPQVLVGKANALKDIDITWHMVGHLQRNKVAKTLEHTSIIHSVDSVRLATAIDRIACEHNRMVEILLEVNVSGDAAKQGFEASELSISISQLAALKNVRLRGLMCMAGLTSDEAETRTQFAALRELRDQLQLKLPTGHEFTELSMGMSGDFEMAIAEGATMVRIGSILFEGLI